ncbi:thioredoxin family protein [Vulcaniibacterium tengchongense]|uniref:Thioredoxin 1 n=1 Tax=Vulcaniibacterium tengchongense TaxID=1273429 RepID=A0A3N4V9P1_9GAMM|nr:thioredoxin family protein [Vulcaniibacterium tengchongense]RPE79702.1 thioredoxin 1 [Vulcaniibacterium tengchongense]
MSYQPRYADVEPTRAEVDALPGATLLEFGAPWCGHCLGAQPAIETALRAHPDLRHLKIEDGRGRPLGRSFRVKLWPTLVLLRDGEERMRLVRPQGAGEIARALAALDPATAGGASAPGEPR